MIKKNLWIGFLPIWILVNVIGWFVNTAILITPYVGWKIPLSAALILGLLQWIVLNKFLSVDWRWAFAGIPVYGSLTYALYFTSDLALLTFLAILIPGLLGWLQYKVLDEYIDGATNWILINSIAGLLSFSFAFTLFGRPVLSMGELLGQFWIIYGFVYGITTGTALVLLMIKPKNDGNI